MASEKIPQYVGWYQPHIAVNWTGEILDPKTGELVKEPSMAKQSFKDECDVNNIVKRFMQTGIIEHLNQRAAQGAFIDLPDPVDYQGSLNMVIAADAAFASVPAEVRNRFQNDPVAFLDFMGDPANQQEIIDMGLATDNRPQEPPTPSPTPETPPEG
ncbi:MAG: internal scaffolding protein [Microvirus sp.]|nr:MAG: internal scaffolding protein [Microvirus sp.]